MRNRVFVVVFKSLRNCNAQNEIDLYCGKVISINIDHVNRLACSFSLVRFVRRSLYTL